MAQEQFVASQLGLPQPDTSSALYMQYQRTDSVSAIMNFLYGDAAAVTLGYAPIASESPDHKDIKPLLSNL